MQCIFEYVRALSRDLIYSNHSLSNFSEVSFLFLHSLGRSRPEAALESRCTPKVRYRGTPPAGVGQNRKLNGEPESGLSTVLLTRCCRSGLKEADCRRFAWRRRCKPPTAWLHRSCWRTVRSPPVAMSWFWASLEGVKSQSRVLPRGSSRRVSRLSEFPACRGAAQDPSAKTAGASAYVPPAPRPTASRGSRIDCCGQALNTSRLRR